jgi:Zn finger protein HypA/HybF involved in hydrogenase expression
MVSHCNNLCSRHRKADAHTVSYRSGKIAYCRNCSHMFYKEDVIKYRCPCCKSLVRTHLRSSRRKEMQKMTVKRY